MYQQTMSTNPLSTHQKLERLRELGRLRQQTRWPGYNNVADYHNGVYESDFVSPYSKSAHNVDATLMIMLQDWASDNRMSGPVHPHKRDFGHSPELATNKNLFRLLRDHFEMELGHTFATNVMPFVKLGGMSAGIPTKDMVRAASEFAIPQIDIIQPVTVACLGLPAFNSIAIALGRKRAKSIEEGVNSPLDYGEIQIWCQGHTGALGTIGRNRGGVNRVEGDWARMAAAHKLRLQELGR